MNEYRNRNNKLKYGSVHKWQKHLHKHRFLLLLLAVATLAGCTRSVNPDHQNNSIYDSILAAIRNKDNKRALAIVDSVEAAGVISTRLASLCRVEVFCYDETTIDTARIILERILRQGGLDTNERKKALERMVYVSRFRNDDESMLRYAPQYIELCHQLGDEVEALVAQSDLGYALIRMGRTSEGCAKMDDAIAQLDPLRRFTEMDACIRVLKTRIRTFCDIGRYEETIPLGERIVAKLKDFEEHPADYADNSYKIPSDNERAGYIDFYIGQAYAFMSYAYAMTGQTGKARENMSLFEQTDYGQTTNGRKLISSTWCQLGEFDKMLAFYDELKQLWGADTMHSDYAIMLSNRAIAERARGHLEQSIDYLNRYTILMQKLNDAERMAAAQEYAARYREQEQQAALEAERIKSRNNRMLAVSAITLLIMLVCFTVYLSVQHRTIRRKNEVLSKEIADRIGYEELYRQTLANNANETQKEPTPDELAAMSDARLFEYLRSIIVDEELYLDPLFERERLEKRLNISKERIGSAFAHGSPYGSLKGFLGEVRLQHSTKLLIEQPEMSISDVATSSGFASYVVFARNFKQRFALTPTDFREKKSNPDN